MTERKPVPDENNGESGFALVTVLAFLLLAAAVSVPFLTSAHIEAKRARNKALATHDKFALQSIARLAAFRYIERFSAADGALPESVSCSLGERDILTISFRDHAGLIDLNAADAGLIAVGFESLGVNRADSARLAGLAVLFRTPGAVADGQEAENITGGPKRAPWESVAELFDLGLPSGIGLDRLRNVFTVHSRSGTVDKGFAPPALAAAFAAAPEAAQAFLVSDTRRLPALSLRLSLRHATGAFAGLLATVGRSDVPGGHQLLEPFRVLADEVPVEGTPADCAQLFPVSDQDLMREIAA